MDGGHASIGDRMIDALYSEALLLADEARGYFEEEGRAERDALTPLARIGYSCEALRVTTRLMHVVAWLLTRRAVAAGELTARQAASRERRLSAPPRADDEALEALPAGARRLADASIELYARVERLDRTLDQAPAAASPALGLLARLERAF